MSESTEFARQVREAVLTGCRVKPAAWHPVTRQRVAVQLIVCAGGYGSAHGISQVIQGNNWLNAVGAIICIALVLFGARLDVAIQRGMRRDKIAQLEHDLGFGPDQR